ncbi:MAG: DEAD/DEAH box helicase [Verrucomicrobia bacterium]|jgi:ATP-dependent RNA helicase DeaD|nr:DEAD/DEAH box helicase [Verrucomicrobiota bacterium]MBT7066693.1 DEAD/DEAH box helicase [Verrucomicrobiota bacterium]MBT7701362.1 DEAD/DEAH box helicase [Verrucomicrobiota bacterium]
MTFMNLGLAPELLAAISRLGFETPTPVQAQVIPRLLENKGDLVALAQTGTGKTAAFGLPILTMLDHDNRAPQALVLCPTRELCVQIARDMEAYAACSSKVRILAVYGGTPIDQQLRALKRGVHVVVGTPGRMLDIMRRGRINLTGIQRVILDEADEMLNMGFEEDLEAILAGVPDEAHTLLFSATMPRQVASIAKKYMRNAEEITVGQRNAGATNVRHDCYVVHQRDRYRTLRRIADFYPDMYGIVFCRTRQDTQGIADWLIRDGYDAEALHGDLSQMQRDRVMGKFRARALQILVATDVAARGLDVNDLTHVINFNLPDDLNSYTHRSGRTGRAGKNGISVVIVNMREKSRVQRIQRMIGSKFEFRSVPDGRDVCQAQLLSMIDRMRGVEVDHELDSFLPAINASLEGMQRDEIIKRFVALEFRTLIKYYRDTGELATSAPASRSNRQAQPGPRTTPTPPPMPIRQVAAKPAAAPAPPATATSAPPPAKTPAKAPAKTPAKAPKKTPAKARDNSPAPLTPAKAHDEAPAEAPAKVPAKASAEAPAPAPDEAPAPAFAAPAAEAPWHSREVRMFINLGQLDGINPRKLSDLINHECKREVPVRKIDIMRRYSFFELATEDVKPVMAILSKAAFGGRSVRTEPVDDELKSKRVKRTERRVKAKAGKTGPHLSHRKGKPGKPGTGKHTKRKSAKRKPSQSR